MNEEITFKSLYDRYCERGVPSTTIHSGHELIAPDDNLQILSKGGVYKKVKFISRHKTPKPLVKITCSNNKSVIVTTDHICMSYNDDNMLENTAAKDLHVGSFVRCYNPKTKKEINGTVERIEDLGVTEDYVYDVEVEDDSHVFYANDILVHNSLFLNIQAITQDLANKWGIVKDTNKWSDEQKLELWNLVSEFVDNTLIPAVQKFVTDMCHTSNAAVLRYGLEYIGSGGIYESRKHYGVHKIVDEGPELVDKFKFTGIEIKKATVPPEIKNFLKDIYCTAIVDPDFDDEKMKKKLADVYEKVKVMPVDEIGQWRGYNTECKMGEGFLNAEKGMTGISKAVGYYNQIAEDLGIGKKYGTIEVGEKIQTVYIKPANKYGIDVIAFKPRAWPVEFDQVFEIDRNKMFDKLIMSPLKNFFEALKFTGSKQYDPSVLGSLAYSVDDL